LDRDESAAGELFARYMNWLVDALKARYPSVARYDETLVLDAVTDALFDYITRPQAYKPDLKGLKGFFYLAAYRNLLNAWRSVRQTVKLETSLDRFVELQAEAGNSSMEEIDTAEHVLSAIALGEKWKWVQTLLTDEKDLLVAALLTQGVRETSAYAEVLGLTRMPFEEQRRQVKRAKDRVLKRLQRADWSHLSEKEASP
jgi:RNA polymerase sigma-70 factor (ECF subfamily)